MGARGRDGRLPYPERWKPMMNSNPQLDAYNPPTVATVPEAGMIWFTGHDGTAWSVREVTAVGVPGAQAPRCLLFERSGAIRRVWRYPATWAQMAGPDLAALCERR